MKNDEYQTKMFIVIIIHILKEVEERISGTKEKIEKNSWKEMFNLKEKKRDSVLKYQENLEHYEKIKAMNNMIRRRRRNPC